MAELEDNFTVGERVEVNGVLGTIDRIGGFQVRSDVSTRIMNKPRNDVRDPTNHQTGEQIILRAGSPVEIKMSNNTWVLGTLLIKYYRVILDGRQPSMVSHRDIRRLTPVVALPPIGASATAPQNTNQPIQMGVEPNPPYRFAELLECLSQDGWVSAALSSSINDSLHSFMILNPETGRIIERPINMVRTLLEQPVTNLNVRIGDTVFYEADTDRPIENYIQGIVVDKRYNVNYRTENGMFVYNHAKSTNEIRRPQEEEEEVTAVAPAQQRQRQRQRQRQAPPTPVAPAPLEQPIVATPTQSVAVAFEIHNAFDSFKFENFMNIIKKKQSNFKNKNAPLQPLIDNVNANPNLTPENKSELIKKLKRIFATVKQYSNYNKNKENIMNCIQYVLMQPQGFIDIYINTFVTDCLKAYATGNSQSCIKGMYERIYFAFRDTVSTMCLDQIQGTGAAPLCKPEYIEIFNCFYAEMPTEMLNDYAKDWVKARGEAVKNLSEEARIEDFVEFVRRRVNNVANFRESERSVRKYAAANINYFMGGQKKRKKTLKKCLKPKRKSKKTIFG